MSNSSLHSVRRRSLEVRRPPHWPGRCACSPCRVPLAAFLHTGRVLVCVGVCVQVQQKWQHTNPHIRCVWRYRTLFREREWKTPNLLWRGVRKTSNASHIAGAKQPGGRPRLTRAMGCSSSPFRGGQRAALATAAMRACRPSVGRRCAHAACAQPIAGANSCWRPDTSARRRMRAQMRRRRRRRSPRRRRRRPRQVRRVWRPPVHPLPPPPLRSVLVGAIGDLHLRG